MSTKTITITSVEDLQAGDIAIFNIGGHEYTGPVYGNQFGSLRFAAYLIRYRNGVLGALDEDDFVSASREVPELPTEPLSVITNVAARHGGEFPLAVLASNDTWYGTDSRGGVRWIPASEIISFELAKVVPADA